jgi:hypothetical protein
MTVVGFSLHTPPLEFANSDPTIPVKRLRVPQLVRELWPKNPIGSIADALLLGYISLPCCKPLILLRVETMFFFVIRAISPVLNSLPLHSGRGDVSSR